jgi:hypothetical protein
MNGLQRLISTWAELDRENTHFKITPEFLKAAHNAGYSQADVARETGFTEQWVSAVKIKGGLEWGTPRELSRKSWPWKVPSEFQQTYLHKVMRNHAEYMASGGKDMKEYKLAQLRRFYALLRRENVVVEFNPEFPPNESASTGGWDYVPREESDGNLIIRVNEYTSLTPIGQVIYRFPPKVP